MEARAQEHLNDILEELLKQEFKAFKIWLATEPHNIPQGKTEELDKLSLANLVIKTYNPIRAMKVAVSVLEKVKRKDLSERLQKLSQDVINFTSPPVKDTSEQTEEIPKEKICSYLTSLTAELQDTCSMSPDMLAKMTSTTQVDGQLIFDDCRNLKWVDWDGKIPGDAVFIENTYLSRRDYVAKVNSSSGFYTPSKGPYCFFTLSDKELRSTSFQVLVNMGNLERLEWKEGSWGSIPPNAIHTQHEQTVFVGKNKYGLGKVVTRCDAFFHPYNGKEYCYKWYDVLTVCKDFHIENISNVHYKMEEGRKDVSDSILHEDSPKNQRISCQHCWKVDHSFKRGVYLQFTSPYPITKYDKKGDIVFDVDPQNEGNVRLTKKEMQTVDENIELPVSPNQGCELVIQTKKINAYIPFQATLSRTYKDGQIRNSTIHGLYTVTGNDIVSTHDK